MPPKLHVNKMLIYCPIFVCFAPVYFVIYPLNIKKVAMAYIMHKKINGKTYYYAEQRVWRNGKSTRAWQKYLGSIDKIIEAVEGNNLAPEYAVIFELGGVAAYLNIAGEIDLVKTINEMPPKRDQGLSIGDYIMTASINRGLDVASKRSMWNWFQNTILLNYYPGIKKEQLSSQRFWGHMDKIPEDQIPKVWNNVLQTACRGKSMGLSQVSYDETNYYSFISTFNTHCSLAQRGKNKQGRSSLRQINYALFCSRENHIPLYFDVYQGNKHDSKEFSQIVPKFKEAFKDHITGNSQITLVFDKGNNSPDNIKEIEEHGFHYAGSLKLNEHPRLAGLSNSDEKFTGFDHPRLAGIKAYRIKKQVYGGEKALIVTFNNNLYHDQVKTINNDIEKCQLQLSRLSRRLHDRAEGLTSKGKKPTRSSVEKNVQGILKRQSMKKIFTVEYHEKNNIPLISYQIGTEAYSHLLDTYLGKKILFTNNHHWSSEDIILAYHSQYIIENIFKESKDRETGYWWPLNHWTDQKIKVHALYCTITLLLRSLLNMKAHQASINLSMRRVHRELNGIKQAINVYPKQKGKGNKKQRKARTITNMNEVQEELFDTFQMNNYLSV